MEQEIAAINGRVHALSLVLTQVLMTLTPAQANQVALNLAIEREALQTEAAHGTPPAELASAEVIVGVYLELLAAVSQRG